MNEITSAYRLTSIDNLVTHMHVQPPEDTARGQSSPIE